MTNAINNVLQTFAVVFLIVLTLLGLRSGLVIASIVPFSMMFALIGMGILEISLEQTSGLAFTIKSNLTMIHPVNVLGIVLHVEASSSGLTIVLVTVMSSGQTITTNLV